MRYVVLLHDHPRPHYDWMFETDEGRLRTWRAPVPPAEACDVVLEPLPDHRPEYLEYEGPVSGGRGTVRRVAAGTYEEQGGVTRLSDGTNLRISASGGRWRAERSG